MSRFTSLFALFSLLCFVLIHSIDASRGRCEPLPKWSIKEAAYGFSQPACTQILRTSQITHYWLDYEDIPDVDANRNGQSQCASQTAFVYDEPAQSLFQVLDSEGQNPSALCQQIIGITMCFAQFKRCDPNVDNEQVGHVTKEANKPCKWLCELLHEEKSICSVPDRNYLKLFGIDLDTMGSLPQLECDNPDYWSQSENCFAPSAILPRLVAPRCEEYRGLACSAVHPSGTRVFIPSATEQEELEAHMPFATMFNSLPLSSNTCAKDWTTHQCQLVFPECVEHGLSYYEADEEGMPKLDTDGKKMHHVFPLRAPRTSCRAYVDSCSIIPFFLNPSIQELFKFPHCDTSTDLYQNSCFPILDETRAIDYHPTTPMEIASVNLSAGPNFHTQATSGYTIAQTKKINRVRGVYHFNSKGYMDPLEYDEYFVFGPMTKKPALFYGQTRSASTRNVDAEALSFPEDCPPPLVRPRSYANMDPHQIGSSNIFRGRCALPCPSAEYSNKDRRIIRATSLVFVVISIVVSAILLVSLLIFHSQRHKRLLMWYTLTYLLAALFLFQGIMPTADQQCLEGTYRSTMTGFGLYTSIFTLYFLISSTAWWCMQAIDLLERLILGRIYKRGSRQERFRKIAMHLFCWLMPVFAVAGVGAGQQFGYDGRLPFSFITIDPQMTSDPIDLSWPFFFVPIIVLFTVGAICILIVLFFLVQYNPTDGIQKFTNHVNKQSSFYYKMGQFVKLFGFVLLIIVFFVLYLIYQISVGQNGTKWHHALIHWAESTVVYAQSSVEVPPPSSRMSIGLILITVFAFSSPGWIMFILYFVASSDMIKLWCGLFHFKLGCNCCQKWAKEDTRTDSSTGSASGGSSAHGSSDILTGDVILKKSNVSVENTQSDGSDKTRAAVYQGADSTHTSTVMVIKPSTSVRDERRGSAAPHSSSHNHHSYHGTEQERRNNLFKGFKNTNVAPTPIAAPPRSQSRSITLETQVPPPSSRAKDVPAPSSSSLSSSAPALAPVPASAPAPVPAPPAPTISLPAKSTSTPKPAATTPSHPVGGLELVTLEHPPPHPTHSNKLLSPVDEE